MTTRSEIRVVIVGAGFGGLWTAKALSEGPVHTTIVDRNNYHTFMPLLYQIAAAELGPDQPVLPVRSALRRIPHTSFIMGEAEAVNTQAKVLKVDGQDIPYDYLVIATGSRASFFGIPGAEEHALPLRSLAEAEAIRNRLLLNFEAAAHEDDPNQRRALTTTAIVGGGPTGVELAGALAELINRPLRKDFPALEDSGRIVLIEAGDRVLGTFAPRLSAYAARRLQSMGVEVRLGTIVRGVSENGVELDGDELVPAKTVVWSAGVRAEGLGERSGLPVKRNGQIETDACLRVRGFQDVFAVGDIAAPEGTKGNPQLAQVAMQGGTHSGRMVLRIIEGRNPERFVYHDKGTLAVVGRNAAVAERGRIKITGFPAWVAWVGVHIYQLIGFRNRLAVLVNWAWDYAFFERGVRVILPSQGSASQEEPRDTG